MRKIIFVFILTALFNNCFAWIITEQKKLEGRNISTWIWNTGVFNQDLRTNNTPGLEWPKGTGKFACFTAGLSIGTYVNEQLRFASASYNGEYVPGYIFDSLGIPVFRTNSSFRLYSVKNTDSYETSIDYRDWKYMVPFGAPYLDINNNKKFDELIDMPGISKALQTVFICMTDADSTAHTTSEGLPGGTSPINAEVHFTSWTYDIEGLRDAIFYKWMVFNKGTNNWEKTKIGVFEDCGVGEESDDYVGYDSTLKLGYCYNADNFDDNGMYRSYGANPPASGFKFLQTPVDKILNDTLEMSFTPAYKNFFYCTADPNTPKTSYNYMNGKQRDGTPWKNPTTDPPIITKKVFTGNPVDSTGWTEKKGAYIGCSNDTFFVPMPPGDRRYYMFNISENFIVKPNEKQKLIGCQMVARGNSHLNSIVKLRELTNVIDLFYNIAIKNDSDEQVEDNTVLPASYKLHQNYPNPFNPVTTIKYEVKSLFKVKIQVYDIRGELISTLINAEQPQGVYEIKFDASKLPSGIYFIKMVSGGGFEDSKKMVVLK